MVDANNLPPRSSVAEIQSLRTCHPSTIRRARKLGYIKGFKIGKTTWVYDRDSILAWLHLAPPDSVSSARPSEPQTNSDKDRPTKAPATEDGGGTMTIQEWNQLQPGDYIRSIRCPDLVYKVTELGPDDEWQGEGEPVLISHQVGNIVPDDPDDFCDYDPGDAQRFERTEPPVSDSGALEVDQREGAT